MIDKDGYRKNVGIILCNLENKLLICKRLGEKSWQFPQGGFEENENAESAMFRELFEEVGLEKSDITILGSTNEWLKYDLPKKYQTQIVDPDGSDQANSQAQKSYGDASEESENLHAYREAAH